MNNLFAIIKYKNTNICDLDELEALPTELFALVWKNVGYLFHPNSIFHETVHPNPIFSVYAWSNADSSNFKVNRAAIQTAFNNALKEYSDESV